MIPKTDPTDSRAFDRLWLGFMTARIMVALALLVLQATVYTLGQMTSAWPSMVCLGYLGACLTVRILAKPSAPGKTFDVQWVSTIGIDLLVYAALELGVPTSINYSPLFALPVLLASVLGSALLALGTAAAATLMMLLQAWWLGLSLGDESTARYLQAGLTGTGFFVVALLANQMSTRLAKEEQAARASQKAARIQTRVNELVIENLADGVLVVDINGIVRSANPAARRLLGPAGSARAAPFVLAAEPSWQPLVALTQEAFHSGEPVRADLVLEHRGLGPTHVHARTRLTEPQGGASEALCVVFIEDLRETEARVRTEKLAAMGRMSAAVAHEIRNPLAAIAQANALLEEDLADAHSRQLTAMIGQNARRLARIVEEVLDVSRAQDSGYSGQALLPLRETVRGICADWVRQHRTGQRLRLGDDGSEHGVRFDPEHLRRVLINLLDNALRYASERDGAIVVDTRLDEAGQPRLSVWSDGEPMESSVQSHLFEPFFSSESRSSGLGLYICRELCARHGAVIGYDRREGSDGSGNEFHVSFDAAPAGAASAAARGTIAQPIQP